MRDDHGRDDLDSHRDHHRHMVGLPKTIITRFKTANRHSGLPTYSTIHITMCTTTIRYCNKHDIDYGRDTGKCKKTTEKEKATTFGRCETVRRRYKSKSMYSTCPSSRSSPRLGPPPGYSPSPSL